MSEYSVQSPDAQTLGEVQPARVTVVRVKVHNALLLFVQPKLVLRWSSRRRHRTRARYHVGTMALRQAG